MTRLRGLAFLWLFMSIEVGCSENGQSHSDDPSAPGGTDEDAGLDEPWVEETVDSAELPGEVLTVEILLSEEDRARLEAAPFYGEDVPGTFIDGEGQRYEDVDISFRGAYALLNLINGDPIGRRNWKVKFTSQNKYLGRREWNFNFEPHLRQKLSYDLMKFAGVKVPNAEHVLLKVNGGAMGLYLQYEDPDSKDWLYDKFGSDEGDLYKAAVDLPPSEGEPEKKIFADTTYLGDDDESYLYHYNKKTNHKDPAIAGDFRVIREFLDGVNHTADEDLQAWMEEHFDADAFISYAVVSNFISNWDGFPQRPKNFWLFENRRESEMVFIPWDMDATFQTGVDAYNQMGPGASVFFNLKAADYDPIHVEEGTERPLAWRFFSIADFEQAYVDRYRELLETILSESYLQGRVDALAGLVAPHLTDTETSGGWRFVTTERSDFEYSLEDMREFISARTAWVSEELAGL